MKRIFKLTIIFLGTVCVVSCMEDHGIYDTIEPTWKTDNSHFAIIESMGFSLKGIIEQDDCYIVEGDIAIEKEGLDSFEPATRQAHYNLITNGRQDGIRVKITSNNIPDAGWLQATRNAIDIWNSVPNCNVYFYKITNSALIHDTKVTIDGSAVTGRVVALGAYPNNGRPGSYVKINPDYNDHTIEQKTYTMVHELGHVLGVSHTDTVSKNTQYHIDGTPDWHKPGQAEIESVMYSESGDRSWGDWAWTWGELTSGRFTNGDILAIQNLYGSPDYSISIVGPESLNPGETATYNIESASLLQGYMGDFATTWTTDEQILSQTNTSVTIRCNHPVQHPVTISAMVDYNNKIMRSTYVVNESVVSCYKYYHNQTVSGNTTVSGCGIWAGDVVVQNGAGLTLRSPITVIDAPFVINAGSSFVLMQ